MTGETSLGALLRSMNPELNEGDYVCCTVADSRRVEGVEVIGSFREREGLTVILERSQAQQLRLDCDYVMAWITLTVHSSLAAVGLTAAFASALGAAGISCNVVAGFYHDHLFVGKDDAQQAMETLRALATNA
ncbi:MULTISPECIES: ACT domain-containing protein [unclassified Pseudomonas]|uniref:ACT domain-containing protein n=1 Tax=unclassified Pseudomonas TaxID=196821 RepID=UPI00177DB52E|nr:MULTISPECIES: ACT domain-containing protein [unclassified Pseudomonas]MBD8705226.1 ACT domain-containing protein [Pseudomonas sp. CFBP 13711]MBD8711660.1 ACT domain-containing protein [Pseudomonas sp. CFBP 13715]